MGFVKFIFYINNVKLFRLLVCICFLFRKGLHSNLLGLQTSSNQLPQRLPSIFQHLHKDKTSDHPSNLDNAPSNNYNRVLKNCIVHHSYPETFHYYFKKLSDDWKYYFVDMQPLTPKRSRFPKYDNGEYKWKINHKFIPEHTDILQEIERKTGTVVLEVLEYTLMLQEFLHQILITKETVWWLNFMPNFLYTPYLSFERGRNQQGLFVYQAYLSFDENIYDAHILSQQRVWPDYVIVVENKEKILQELDFLGINGKFIYGDYDNIARYIKQKYEHKNLRDK